MAETHVLSSKSDVAYAELRRRILSGDLAPGSRLAQYELATSLNMSITPLREAIRKLSSENLVDLDGLTRRTVLYNGTAGEAALLYPQNANVAAAVALAGLGFNATEVELVADPDAAGNIHEIEAEGVAGRFAIQLQGKASRTNPKTSALAALSVARALLNQHATIVI